MPRLLIGAVCIAFSPIFVRLSEIGPLATAFYRVYLALPVLWLFVAHDTERNFPSDGTRPRDWLYMFLAGVLFALDLIAWHTSIMLTSVANATLLANFAPVFVTIGSWLLFKERFSVKFLVALALGIAGAATLMGDSLQLDHAHLAGDALGLLTAVFYGGYILTVSRLRRRLPTFLVMAVSGLVSALMLLPVAVYVETDILAYTAYGWAILAGLALISHTGGQGMITFSLAHLPAAFSSLTLLLQPVIAAFLAWWLLDESLRTWQSVGALMVLWAIVLARLERVRRD
ncbi:MAG: DMT family transporter [Gammaproteobacteria bacterium]|nr:DMT family transporter [Gammaproteobacteria bacterium]